MKVKEKHSSILLMAEIMHYLGCMNSFWNKSDTPPFTRCRIAYINSMGWVFSLSQSVCVCVRVWVLQINLALALWDRPGRATLLRNSTGSKSGSPILRHAHLLLLFPWKYFKQSSVLWMHMKMMHPKRTSRIVDYMFPLQNPAKQ